MIGPKNAEPNSPSAAPLLATINATSQREIIPTFKKTGVIIVVITTTIMIGPKNAEPNSPSAAPLLATINATSQREIIPIPIRFA